MLADEVDYVIGVDTHRDQHTLAVVVAPTGAVVAQTVGATRPRTAMPRRCGSPTQPRRRRSCLGDRGRRPLRRRARALTSASAARAVHRGRPQRPRRAATSAARTIRSTRSGRHARCSQPTTLTLPRAGERQEALRVLLLARRSAVDVRRLALVQLRSVIVTAPESSARSCGGCPSAQLLRRCSRFRRSQLAHTRRTRNRPRLRSLARRIEAATEEADELEREILAHVRALVPELLDEPGVGPIVAAQLIVTWSHRDRVRSEAAFARLAGVAPLPASSGQTIRHRLSRGGDRQLNRALHTVILHRRQHDPATKRLHRPPRRRRQERHATRPASSSATSPATSTASCRTRAR